MDGNVFGKRAGEALDALVPGKNRDKAIARMFGVTTRMARYLRSGQCWTVERLSLASAVLGKEFNELLIPRGQPIVPVETLREDAIEFRLERIEDQLDQLLAECRELRGRENERTEKERLPTLRLMRGAVRQMGSQLSMVGEENAGA